MIRSWQGMVAFVTFIFSCTGQTDALAHKTCVDPTTLGTTAAYGYNIVTGDLTASAIFPNNGDGLEEIHFDDKCYYLPTVFVSDSGDRSGFFPDNTVSRAVENFKGASIRSFISNLRTNTDFVLSGNLGDPGIVEAKAMFSRSVDFWEAFDLMKKKDSQITKVQHKIKRYTAKLQRKIWSPDIIRTWHTLMSEQAPFDQGSDPDAIYTWYQYFEDYGTHVMTESSIGAKLDLYYVYQSTNATKHNSMNINRSQCVTASVEGGFDSIHGGAKTNTCTNSTNSAASGLTLDNLNQNGKIKCYGGGECPEISDILGPNTWPKNLKTWEDGIHVNNNALGGLYTFPKKVQDIHHAVVEEWASKSPYILKAFNNDQTAFNQFQIKLKRNLKQYYAKNGFCNAHPSSCNDEQNAMINLGDIFTELNAEKTARDIESSLNRAIQQIQHWNDTMFPLSQGVTGSMQVKLKEKANYAKSVFEHFQSSSTAALKSLHYGLQKLSTNVAEVDSPPLDLAGQKSHLVSLEQYLADTVQNVTEKLHPITIPIKQILNDMNTTLDDVSLEGIDLSKKFMEKLESNFDGAWPNTQFHLFDFALGGFRPPQRTQEQQNFLKNVLPSWIKGKMQPKFDLYHKKIQNELSKPLNMAQAFYDRITAVRVQLVSSHNQLKETIDNIKTPGGGGEAYATLWSQTNPLVKLVRKLLGEVDDYLTDVDQPVDAVSLGRSRRRAPKGAVQPTKTQICDALNLYGAAATAGVCTKLNLSKRHLVCELEPIDESDAGVDIHLTFGPKTDLHLTVRRPGRPGCEGNVGINGSPGNFQFDNHNEICEVKDIAHYQDKLNAVPPSENIQQTFVDLLPYGDNSVWDEKKKHGYIGMAKTFKCDIELDMVHGRTVRLLRTTDNEVGPMAPEPQTPPMPACACDRTKHFMLDDNYPRHDAAGHFTERGLGPAGSQDEAEARCLAFNEGHGVFYTWHNRELQYNEKYNNVRCFTLLRPAAENEFFRQYPAYGIVGGVCLPGIKKQEQDQLLALAPEARGGNRHRRMIRGRAL